MGRYWLLRRNKRPPGELWSFGGTNNSVDMTPVLKALAKRIDVAKVDQFMDTVGATDLTEFSIFDWKRQCLLAFADAGRLRPVHYERLTQSLMAASEKRSIQNCILIFLLASRLSSDDAHRLVDGLMTTLESAESLKISSLGFAKSVEQQLTEGLTALVPRMTQSELSRGATLVSARLREPTDPYARLLSALAPRLEGGVRDRLSMKVAKIALDTYNPSTDDPPGRFNEFAIIALLSSPRLVARLLSHPGCVGKMQELCLERFEELLFYDGKPVLLSREETDSKRNGASRKQHSVGQPFRRRFQTTHEVADWIKQNWPDFDLEASEPGTWHDSN